MIRRLSASARLGQAALVDQERGLLLGLGDDPLGLLLGLLDDPLALGVDPLGGADLLGDGDPQLVDEAERGVLVDDDVVGQRQLLAVRDQRLEALDEEDDVDRRPSWLGGRRRPAASPRLWHADRPVSASARASAQGLGGGRRDHRRHVAAEARDLLDQARADVAVLDRGHEEDRVDLGGEDAVVVGELHLGLEVADGAQAADDGAWRRGPGRSRR